MPKKDWAEEYVRRIKHEGKREYAWACLRALRAGQPLPPDPPRDRLSLMGAQAVRINLYEFFPNA